MMRPLAILLALSGVVRAAVAQCPDGSPPPCERERRAAIRSQPPSASERGRRFLVLPFRNITRAPEQEWLVEGSPILLADAIGRWQDLSIVSDERLYPALRRHGLQPGAVMELAKVRRVAEETKGWTAVTGEVLAIGGRVRVSARAYDVVTNRELVRATAETQPGEDVRHAYSRIGSRLLGAAGLDSTARDVEAATTQSLDAYRAYLRGVGHLRRSEVRRAREALLEAVRLDTAFAQAYLRLAEASFAISPADVLDLTSPAIRYLERAAALADRLPPRRRDLVRAIADMVHGRFGAARATLARLLASDSLDVDATEWMGSLETVDPLLVPAPGGGERPRGSLNAGLRLLKRTLELDPARHQLYSDLVVHHARVAGFGSPRIIGLRREPPSMGAMLMAPPDRSFAVILRDSFELVPAESLATVPADTQAASKRRAIAAAGQWARRWRQEAPGEADAHVWMARIYDFEGSLDSALASINRADSIGVETGIEATPVRRISLMRRLGQLPAARVIADSMYAAGTFTPFSPTTRADAAIEVLRILLLTGDYTRADRIVSGLADLFAMQAPRDFAEMASLGILSGGNENTAISLPRPALMESLLTVVRRQPPTGRAARWVPPLLAIMARGLGTDTAAVRAPMLAAARDLAGRGQQVLPYFLVMALDSAGRTAAEGEPWFAARKSAMRDTALATARRFEPLGATVSGDSAVFEWSVAGGDSATWNRATSPMIRSEYTWLMSAAGYHVVIDYSGLMDDQEHRGTLAQLIAAASKAVIDTTAKGQAEMVARMTSGGAVRATVTPGKLRVVVRHPGFLAALRRIHPATAKFTQACPKEDASTPVCEREVPVNYP